MKGERERGGEEKGESWLMISGFDMEAIIYDDLFY